jgi:hypothetical protein
MSDATSNLTIRIGSTGDFAALETARAQTEMLRESLGGLKTVLEGFGASLGLGALVEFGRSINDIAVATVRLSEQAHISTQAFEALSYVALSAGMNQEGLASKIEILNKSMALASEGSSKQNKAIADLGLNTAELLAMPVEQQIAAIAKAYVNAADKGHAWADVLVLLGKGAADMQQVLTNLGTNGAPKNLWWMPTDEELDRIKKRNEGWETFKAIIEGLAVKADASLGNFMGPGFMPLSKAKDDPNGPIQSAPGGMSNKPGDLDNPIQDAGPDPAEVKAKEIRDSIAGSAEMIAAQQKLTDAINGTGAAYEDLDQKAARLRAESAQEMATAGKLAKDNEFDKEAQVKAIDMLTDATKKLGQANTAEAEADKNYIKQTIALSNEDIATETKRGEAKVAALEAENAAHEKMNAVAMAGIDRDWNLTDNQKWEEKKALLMANVQWLTEYKAKLDAISSDPTNPTGVNNKAASASGKAGTAIGQAQGAVGGMGPDPTSFTQNLSADLTKLQSQWQTLQQSMATGLTGVINSGMQSVENNITKVIQGTETWRKALLNIVTEIEGSVVSSFIQMGVKWVATQIMMAVEGKAVAASSAAAMVPMAMAESEIWAAPAALATIASWGGAAMAAPELVLASMAATEGLALASEGGFFPGDESTPAGIFHGGEYIFSAPAVRNIGADNLERAHSMAKNPTSANVPGTGGGGGDEHHFHMHGSMDEAIRAWHKNPANKKTLIDTHRMAARHV